MSHRSARSVADVPRASRRLPPRAVVLALLFGVPALPGLGLVGCADREVSATGNGAGNAGASGSASAAGAAGRAGVGGAAASAAGNASTGDPPPPPPPNRADPACLANAEGITLGGAKSHTGAPSFAFASCRLAYLAADGSLRDRDLITGTEILLAPASVSPAAPDRADEVVVWDALTDAGRRVHLRRADGEIVVIPTASKAAGEAHVLDEDVVFTVFAGTPDDDTDVALYDGATGAVQVIADGAAQQRFPVLSRRFVAYADFREAGEHGRFDEYRASLADIVVVDRVTGEKTVRALPGKQAFPMLDPELDVLGYLQWDEIRPEPKLGAPYGIRVGSVLTPSLDRDIRAPDDGTSVAELRPSLRAGTFAWLERHDGLRVLSRSAVEGAAAVSHAVDAQATASSPLAIGAEVVVSLRAPGQASETLTRLP